MKLEYISNDSLHKFCYYLCHGFSFRIRKYFTTHNPINAGKVITSEFIIPETYLIKIFGRITHKSTLSLNHCYCFDFHHFDAESLVTKEELCLINHKLFLFSISLFIRNCCIWVMKSCAFHKPSLYCDISTVYSEINIHFNMQ